MAKELTKLKNLHMTSVDLVRNGANQEADICLFKSADPTEAPTEPTTEEKNIFKRFINWLRENPTEDAVEPTAAVEKADDEPYLVEIYKSAITESLQSIVADESLSETEKNDMITKSLDEYHNAMLDLFGFDTEEEPLQKADEEDDLDDWEWDGQEDEVEEVEKFNPNHDELGRFATGSGAGGGGAASGAAKYRSQIDEAEDLDEIDRIVEDAANDDDLTNAEYEEIYSQALQRAQSWQPTAKSADIDDIEEV